MQTTLPRVCRIDWRRMTSERRAFLRVEAELDVICTRVDASGERLPPQTTRSVDISAGGVRVRVAWQRPAGDRLTFGLKFADIKPALQRQLIERTLAAEKRRDA